MKNKLMMILTKEDIERITEKINNEKHTITVDLHGLSVRDAKRLVNNIMALNRDGYDICTIHGYNHGTAIKEMINNEISNPRLVNKKRVRGNYGITVLQMNKVA